MPSANAPKPSDAEGGGAGDAERDAGLRPARGEGVPPSRPDPAGNLPAPRSDRPAGKTVGILQPGYLPWLGFFQQLARCDVFVLYDDVQFDKNGWRNRNRIKTGQGPQWLTVPVALHESPSDRILDVRIDNHVKWRRKHLESIRQSYRRAPFYQDNIGLFESAWQRDWELLVDLDVHFITELSRRLGLADRPLLRSSQMGVGGDRIQRLVDICRAVGADTFYEGAAGRDYIDPEAFAQQGVRVVFQDYRHPVYPQLHGEFVPYLSVVDLLFNCGPESLSILTQGQAQ